MVRTDIINNLYTEEELLKMKKSEAIEGLNESQQRFCEYYVQNYNVKTALIKAGYTADQTGGLGVKLRKKPQCQLYIQWLKARILQETIVKGSEIIEQWVKIAWADMTDFVDIYPTSIRLKKNDVIDGQLIKSIKSGKDGVSIELYDKLRALDSLAKYTADMPKDYRQVLDERRMQLMENEYELKKKNYGIEDEQEDDGFLEALKQSATSVWADEDE